MWGTAKEAGSDFRNKPHIPRACEPLAVHLIPRRRRRRRRRKRRRNRPPVEHSLAFSPNELSFLITNRRGECRLIIIMKPPRSGRGMAARLFPLLSWNASEMHIGRNWTGKSMTPADPKKMWQPASSLSTQSHKQCRGQITAVNQETPSFCHWRGTRVCGATFLKKLNCDLRVRRNVPGYIQGS